ncbi:MAG: hypothetical protein P4L92_14305 [Rudaea sp.]|nr:hypothetical protein [Rudaea sp.]
MNTEVKRKAGPLIRAVAMLQVKLLLGAARDLALSPLTLVAALIDLVRVKNHEPHFFRDVMRVGERTEEWIDMWSAARHPDAPPRENVDALLSRVEEVVRDPQTGARRARVLKRWAERQMARARQRAAEEVSARMKAISDRKAGRDDRD